MSPSINRFSSRKYLGQHFLANNHIVARILDAAELSLDDCVVEIGPGRRVLTKRLVEQVKRVVAVELDSGLARALPQRLDYPANFTCVEADARVVNIAELIVPDICYKVVANLPYYAANLILRRLLESQLKPNIVVVMVQQEAGERIAASVGNPAYGAVSVRVALRGQASIVGQVPPSVFYPRPRVNSVVVAIERVEKNIELKVENQVIELLRIAFNQRRKMLRKSLKGHLREGTIERAHISPTSRPEALDLGQWIALAQLSSLGEP